jgi:hypothetical protein
VKLPAFTANQTALWQRTAAAIDTQHDVELVSVYACDGGIQAAVRLRACLAWLQLCSTDLLGFGRPFRSHGYTSGSRSSGKSCSPQCDRPLTSLLFRPQLA